MDTSPPLSRDERARIVLNELDDILPGGSLTRPALDELRRYFQRRLANPNPEASGSSTSPSSFVEARPDVEKVESPAAPRPSIQELLAERSILIVSYVGAFLLIVATLLFEIYSGNGVSGGIRFLAVLFLDLAFGVAGVVCIRSERLRLIGRTYLAIFALMVPLVFTAAHVYLTNGISAILVVAICGLSSSLLYGALARALQSRAYAYLCLAAFTVGWTSAAHEAGLCPWRGAVVTPLIVLFALAAFPGQRSGLGQLLTEPAPQMAHLISAVAAGWTLAVMIDGSIASGRSSTWYASVTFAGIAIGYLIFIVFSAKRDIAWVVAIAICATVLSINQPLGFGSTAIAAELVVLAWALAIAARWLPDPRPHPTADGIPILRVLAVVLAGGVAFFPAVPALAQALALVAVTGVGILIARDTRHPAWLLFSCAIFSVAWYWMSTAVSNIPFDLSVPRLFAAYAPLPLLLVGLGLVVRRLAARWSPTPLEWSVPFYAAAGLNAVWILLGTFIAEDFRLLAILLLSIGIAIYVASTVEGLIPGGIVSALAIAVGFASLAQASVISWSLFPVALAVAAWLAVVADMAWSRLPAAAGDSLAARRRKIHRWIPVLFAVLAAIVCIFISDLSGIRRTGNLISLGVLWSGALLLWLDARMNNSVVSAYAAQGAAVLGSYWIGTYFGFQNPQAYVTAPGGWLVWAGQRMRNDMSIRNRSLGARISGMGVLLLIATSAIQTLGGPKDALTSNDWLIYTGLLLIEGVAALLVGIVLRNRWLVLAGTAGVGVGGIIPLLTIALLVPLFLLFGIVAILLLGGAAAMTALRGRVSQARATVEGWNDWD